MANLDSIVYNIAVFISTLFLLEYGADKFIDHAVVVARRTGIHETIVGLITAGGEWEELAVVIASLVHDRTSLAIGNVVGSAISNILGAFALGLLFHDSDTPIRFDRSSRIYSLVLLLATTFIIPITYYSTKTVWSLCGPILIALFTIYTGSVAWAIAQGTLTAPEDSDDSSEDDGSDEDDVTEESTPLLGERTETESHRTDGDCFSPNGAAARERNERPNQALQTDNNAAQKIFASSRRTHRSLRYHVSALILGFFAICLAGYILSHAATTITHELGISDVLFGIVVLAIATTLPEKFIAVMSGRRGHAGILVANTAGSNIFLLTLCFGVIMTTSAGVEHGNLNFMELGVLWGSTLAFTGTIWLNGRFNNWIGGGMLIAYLVFIVLEFAVGN